MLWREASTPVVNVDQATGEIDGQAVASSWKQPSAASFVKFGRRPCCMYSRARFGSKPSSPITTTRLAFAGRSRTGVTSRQTALIGQIRMIPSDIRNVPTRTNPVPTTAKPAPGPM